MAACYMLNIMDSYECITNFVEIFQFYDGRLKKNSTHGMGIFPHHGTQTGKTTVCTLKSENFRLY